MSSRFHGKWHRYNHHTLPTSGIVDSSYDPLASHTDPFQGDMVLNPLNSILSSAYIRTNEIQPFSGVWTYVPGNLFVNNLCSISATTTYQEIYVSELSGFIVYSNDDNGIHIPIIAPQATVFLSGLGITGNNWASFVGDIQTMNDLYVSGIAHLGAVTIVGCISTDCIAPNTVNGTISTWGNLDLKNHSISGINNNSLSFESGTKISSDATKRIMIDSYSYAESFVSGTSAYGHYSHAEGNASLASGLASHAEGNQTIASGMGAHTEGDAIWASGEYSHAEGELTKAEGNFSHAEGYSTIALAANSHAEGENAQANAQAAHAEGYMTIASGTNSHAEGHTTLASAQGTHTEGYATTAYGDFSHAEGDATQSNYFSHSEGRSTHAQGLYSHAEGYYTIASGNSGAHAEGDFSSATGSSSHAEGFYTLASGPYAHAEGENTSSSAEASHAEGYVTQALGAYSHAEGDQTKTTNTGAHSEGYKSEANGAYSHAEGYTTTATGSASHAAGQYAVAAHDNTFIWSSFNTPVSTTNTNQFYVSAGNGVVLGKNVTIYDTLTVTTISAISSTIDNLQVTLLSAISAIIDYIDIKEYEVNDLTVRGTLNVNVSGFITNLSAHNGIIDNLNSTTTNIITLSSYDAIINNLDVVTLSAYTATITTCLSTDCIAPNVINGEINIWGGLYLNNYGISGIANDALLFESGTKISSDTTQRILISSYSYAESIGTGTSAYGLYSHAEGENSKAIGYNSHAEGGATRAIGGDAHTEGFNTSAFGDYSHAEGNGTSALSSCAHAEGINTTAAGLYSHAEGTGTTALGLGSHTEGGSNFSIGDRSHSEGFNTSAIGTVSHAAGQYAVAAHDNTFIWSSFNTPVSTTNTNQFYVSAGNGAVIGQNLIVVGNISADGVFSNTLQMEQAYLSSYYIVGVGPQYYLTTNSTSGSFFSMLDAENNHVLENTFAVGSTARSININMSYGNIDGIGTRSDMIDGHIAARIQFIPKEYSNISISASQVNIINYTKEPGIIRFQQTSGTNEYWKTHYFDPSGNFNVDGSLLPRVSGTYDLGSSALPWRDIWLSGASIHMDNTILSVSAGALTINDPTLSASTTIGAGEMSFSNSTIIDSLTGDVTSTGLFMTISVNGSALAIPLYTY